MNATEYQKLAMRTNDRLATNRMLGCCENNYKTVSDFGGIIDACLGMSGEVGEFNDIIKKWVFHEKPIDIAHAKKELGDVLWYIAMMCESFGWDMSEIMQMNIDKLKERYPDGFSVERANNRTKGDI